MMKCTACQKEVDANAVFCTFCGTALKKTDSIPPSTPESTPVPAGIAETQAAATPEMGFVVQAIKRLVRRGSFKAVLHCTIMAVAFRLIALIAEMAAGGNMGEAVRAIASGMIDDPVVIQPLLRLFTGCCALLPGILLIRALFRLYTTAGEPGNGLYGSVRMLQNVAVVACATSLFSSLALSFANNSVIAPPAAIADPFFRWTYTASAQDFLQFDWFDLGNIVLSVIFITVVILTVYLLVIAFFYHLKQSLETRRPRALGALYLSLLFGVHTIACWILDIDMIMLEAPGLCRMSLFFSGAASLFGGILCYRYFRTVRRLVLPPA